MNKSQGGVWAFGLMIATSVVLTSLPLSAQETPAGATKPTAVKEAFDSSRRVPSFFGQIGLTSQQREEIYKIRARRQVQIDALQKQIGQLHAETVAECETTLNDSQRQLLTLRRDASARAKKEKALAPASSVTLKTGEKPAK